MNTTTQLPDNDLTLGISPTQEQIANVRYMLDQLEKRVAGDAAIGPAPVTAPVTTRRRGRAPAPPPAATERRMSMSNAPTFDDVLAAATELGADAGKGTDVQIKFDLKLAEAAYLGTLSLDADKHGKDVDDATRLSAAYWKARNGAVIFDAKADKQRKTISNARKMIKLGSCPKWGVGQPMGRINDLISLRQTFRKDPANHKKLDDAHNALMRYATQQLKRDHLMDDEELKTFVFKGEPEPRTAEEVLESIRKVANNLKVGKVSNCPDLDNSPEVDAIIKLCGKRLTAIAKARAPGGATV